MDKPGILIIDHDEASQAALRLSLGDEDWEMQGVATSGEALRELATGRWNLIVANVATVGFTGALYNTLKELAMVPQDPSGKVHLRILFLVPENSRQHAALLEHEHLSFVQRPFTFNDFLEKVSDLLMEAEAITTPLRRVRQEGATASRRRLLHGARSDRGRDTGRNTGMFANREDYEMTEEEIAEYERHEAIEEQRKKKKNPLSID
jgi:DNA-binding response OmpR family regulator